MIERVKRWWKGELIHVNGPFRYGAYYQQPRVARLIKWCQKFWLRNWHIVVPMITAAPIALFIHFDGKPKQVASVAPENGISTSLSENPSFKSANLVISATGASVSIKKSESGIPYSGGSITSTGSVQIIYLPKGQVLHVTISGTGAQLSVESSIAEQVQVKDTGTGSNVSVL